MLVRPTRHPVLGMLRVLDPNTLLPLPEEGAEKQLDPYWRQLLASGEIEEVKAAPAPAPVQALPSAGPTEHEASTDHELPADHAAHEGAPE